MRLDDWQAYVVDALFDVDADNEWAATEFGLLVSRQNGKGEILVAYDLAHLFLFPRPDLKRKTILHTAHEMKTAIDGFQRLAGVVESTPQLNRRVDRIYTANGQEGIILKKRPGQILGDRIKFVARSKNSGRGFTGDIIVYDEAQELAKVARDALTYTQSTIANRQEFYTGTVPEEGINELEVFEGLRDRGRGDTAARTGWMEWTPKGSEDPKLAAEIDLSDEEVWAESNPAKDIRIRTETIAEQFQRAASNLESFGRERLSIWPNRPEATDTVHNDIDLEAWKASTDKTAMLGPAPVLAIALGRGGGYATIAAASRTGGESIFLETKDTRAQTLWVPGALKALVAKLQPSLVVLDAKNCAPILTDLDMAGIAYMAVNVGELAGGFGLIVESVNAGLVVHRGQDDLLQSLKHATPRPLAGGQTWDQSDPSEPITQIQAVTLAHWGVKKSEANPAKEPAVITGIR